MTLRLPDRHGQLSEVRPQRAGLLVLSVQPGQAWSGARLRAAVLADLVRRVAAAHRVQVRGAGTAWPMPEMNIHPVEPADAAEQVDVHVGSDPGGGTHLVAPGPMPYALPAAADVDPLAIRLLVLETPWRLRLELTAPTLEEAARRLASLRRAVAGFAEGPSKPMCADSRLGILAALDDGLDTVTAVSVLAADGANDVLPPGARFELAAWADRLLGLDLTTDIGRPTLTGP